MCTRSPALWLPMHAMMPASLRALVSRRSQAPAAHGPVAHWTALSMDPPPLRLWASGGAKIPELL